MRSTEEKIKRKVISVVIIVAILSMMAGCGKSQSRKEPITLTIWHVYGGQTDSPLNDLIDEFNETVGKDKNIRVEVGSVTNTNIIHEGVLAAANKEPGASELPDMFVSYPKTVTAMPDPDVLVNYKDYFTDVELRLLFLLLWRRGRLPESLRSFRLRNPRRSCFIIRPPLTVLQRRPGRSFGV